MTPEIDNPKTAARPRQSWLRRYFSFPTVIAVGVVVYLAFFGENSMSQRIAYQRVIDSLSVCLAQQEDSLEFYKSLNMRLSSDPELMEQVVREQYNMNRPHEDVYVVEQQ